MLPHDNEDMGHSGRVATNGNARRKAKCEAFIAALPEDRAILSSEIAETAELIGSRREAEAIGLLLAERGAIGMISGNAFYRLGIRNVRHPVLEGRVGRRG